MDDFDTTLNESERLFKLAKKVDFINPKYTLYGSLAGAFLDIIDLDYLAFIILTTTVIIGMTGLILLFISMRIWRKAYRLFNLTYNGLLVADKDLAHKRAVRHVEALDKIKP